MQCTVVNLLSILPSRLTLICSHLTVLLFLPWHHPCLPLLSIGVGCVKPHIGRKAVTANKICRIVFMELYKPSVNFVCAV